MTCRQEQKLERESINTETYIQEESRKTIRKRTLRTEKKAGILTEITRSRIDNNGVLEECKNGIYFRFLQIKKGGYVPFEVIR